MDQHEKKKWKKENPSARCITGAKISPCNLHGPKTLFTKHDVTQPKLAANCWRQLTKPNYEKTPYWLTIDLHCFFVHKCLQKAGEIHLLKKPEVHISPTKLQTRSFRWSRFFSPNSSRTEIRTWYKVGPLPVIPGGYNSYKSGNTSYPNYFRPFPHVPPFFCGSTAHLFFHLANCGNTPIASCGNTYTKSIRKPSEAELLGISGNTSEIVLKVFPDIAYIELSYTYSLYVLL